MAKAAKWGWWVGGAAALALMGAAALWRPLGGADWYRRKTRPRENQVRVEDDLPETQPTLRRGDSGDSVLEVQRRVGADPDGIFGPQTEARVREFQRLHGLPVDGIVGAATWSELWDA